jgi:peptide/nickel transport system substrate-binding protein
VQWAFDAELEPWPHDPEAARALLREAGFADADGDGVLEQEGRPFHFTFTYAAVGEDNRRLAAWLRDSLAEVGVAVDLEPLTWPALQERLAERRFESLMLGLWMDVDPDPFELWHSSQIETGINRVAYRNEEVDRLLEEGRSQVDRETRREAYRQVQALLHRDQPFTFLFYPASSAAVSRSLRGVGISPRGAYLFWPGPSGWWLAPEEAKEPAGGE